MKFFAFGDQHLEAKLYNIPELENDNRQLFINVVDQAIAEKVDYLVSTGDLFDTNKPASETIEFVSAQLARLKHHNITPVAIAGDHSKPVDGATWERNCGFLPINAVEAFVGIDYSDNPLDVIAKLNRELNDRPKNSVQFIFLHQQIPELWPFCEEKKKISLKDIDFSNHCESLKAIFLGDIHIRREMRYLDPECGREIFVGYCGSLGVTASDETKKDGLYYWCDDTLKLLEYTLPRKFVTVRITEESLQALTPELFEAYRNNDARPVFICRLSNGVDVGNKLNFLYDIGFVKFSKVRQDKDGKEEMVNIRSELKTAERISTVLKELSNTSKNPSKVYETLYALLTTEDPKKILDDLQKDLLQPQLQQPQ